MLKQDLIARALLLAVAFGCVGVADVAAAATREKAGLARPPRSRVETLPRKIGDKPQETVVAINPRDPRNVAVSYHQAVGEGSDHHPNVRVRMRVASTVDGGRKWTVADATHSGYRVSIDAALAFDLRGHLYLVYIGMDQLGRTERNGEYLLRSVDGGSTWEAPLALAENPGGGRPVFEHIPYVAADNDAASPHAGAVYVTWTRNLYDERGDQIIFVRSTDGGKSWSEGRMVSKGVVLGAAVGQGGEIYLLHGLWSGGWDVALVVSRDGGETFEPPVPIARSSLSAQWKADSRSVSAFPRSGGWPRMAVDPRPPGRVFVVWGDYRNGDRDVMVVTSADHGRTWSGPVRVNDDPLSNGKDQLTQIVAVDPSDGAAYVLFYDRRDDPRNLLTTTTLARSADGGRSFTNYRWSRAPSDPKEAMFGDYIGLAALEGRVYGAWVENIATEPGPRKSPHKVQSGSMELEPDDFPFGPAAIRVGIADFRSTR